MKKQLKIALPLFFTIIISFLFIQFGRVDYDTIHLPKFAPPSFVFIIAWSIIYLLMYISVNQCRENKKVVFLYYCVLLSHILWNLIFFFLGYLLIGFIVLVILYFISWVFIYFLYNCKKATFWLNTFYMLWLLVALYLNIGIVLLN